MKIGVISDTHGDVAAWGKALKFFQGCQLILHSGDILYHGAFNPILPTYNPLELAKELNNSSIPIFFAQGNCDSQVDTLALDYPIESPYLHLILENYNILVHHGHLLSQEKILKWGNKNQVNLVISGHTHVRELKKEGKMILLNPGSPSLPKGDEIASIALIEDEGVRIVSLEKGETLNSLTINP